MTLNLFGDRVPRPLNASKCLCGVHFTQEPQTDRQTGRQADTNTRLRCGLLQLQKHTHTQIAQDPHQRQTLYFLLYLPTDAFFFYTHLKVEFSGLCQLSLIQADRRAPPIEAPPQPLFVA